MIGWKLRKIDSMPRLRLLGLMLVTALLALAPVSLPPTSGWQEADAAQTFFLPWEAGSVWRITSDNDGGNHVDQYNNHAFDAVPVSGRSTKQVTAIADGEVVGFQNNVPNEALFNGGHAGNCMMIRHGDGTISLYAHLAAGSIPGEFLHEGAQVRGGMVIGTVGNTGYSTAEHLHWSLLSDGFMYDAEGYRTCAGTSIPSRYADSDAELIEDGGVPRTGRYYESFNAPGGTGEEAAPADPGPTAAPTEPTPEPTLPPEPSAVEPTVTTEPAESDQVILPTDPDGSVSPTEPTIPEMPPVTEPPADSSDNQTSQPSGTQDGPVDIALITRDPSTGDLLTGTCYVLINYSNVGCDENGDGQVTFADIPFGTYTVRQTQAPAGYPTINDYDIVVEGTGYMEGPSIGEPLGFIVKQAPEQTAPDTRNVSVVFLDMHTHERVMIGACVELIGASNVGCDEDLIDGQVDFLDVPTGGPYELAFTNLPAGYEVATVGGPLAVTFDSGAASPANIMVFVLLAGPADAGSVTIEPGYAGSPGDVQSPASTSGVTDATVLMTFRGCPEGFVPDVDDPHSLCTEPLDAPDASLVGEWGVGESLVPIAGLDRQYNGAYVFHVGSGGGYHLELSGLEPVVRDDFLVYGVDDQDGSSYITLLTNGETREIFVFYYYE